jgi:hypothetical protein
MLCVTVRCPNLRLISFATGQTSLPTVLFVVSISGSNEKITQSDV